jgi:hypothetical protein
MNNYVVSEVIFLWTLPVVLILGYHISWKLMWQELR